VAGVCDDDRPAGLQCMNLDTDLMHEGVGCDGRVPAPP
jgi:hypothetical protein